MRNAMISVHRGRTGKRKPPSLYSCDTRKPLFSVQGTPPVFFFSPQTLHYSKRIRGENNQIIRKVCTKGQKSKSWENFPFERSKGTKCQIVKDLWRETGRNSEGKEDKIPEKIRASRDSRKCREDKTNQQRKFGILVAKIEKIGVFDA